jgi:hypothetical protein
METIRFQCDFCGMKSEEESVAWRRPRCSIELVMRGSRFATVSGSHPLYGLPPGAGATPESAEDERWAATLCDRCMKRVAALFGLNLETPEEARWRQNEFMRHVASEAARANGASPGSDMRGVMTDQFPTPSVPDAVAVAARTSPSAPVSVIQYETPRRVTSPKDGESAESDAAPGTLEKNSKDKPDADAEAPE